MTLSLVGGYLAALVVLTLVVALPIKIGARLVGAQHQGLIRCGFAAFVAMLGGLLAWAFLGGLIGGALAWALGYLLAIRAMLGSSFLGAIGIAVVATLLSMLALAVLLKLGLFISAPVAGPTYI